MRASTSWRKRHRISEREVLERGPYPRSTRLRYCVGRKTATRRRRGKHVDSLDRSDCRPGVGAARFLRPAELFLTPTTSKKGSVQMGIGVSLVLIAVGAV